MKKTREAALQTGMKDGMSQSFDHLAEYRASLSDDKRAAP